MYSFFLDLNIMLYNRVYLFKYIQYLTILVSILALYIYNILRILALNILYLEWPFRSSELLSLSILVRLSRASLIDLTTIGRRLTK